MIKIERYLKLQMLRENYEGAGVHLPDDTSLRHGGETRPGGFKGQQLKMAMAMTMTMTMTMTIFFGPGTKEFIIIARKTLALG